MKFTVMRLIRFPTACSLGENGYWYRALVGRDKKQKNKAGSTYAS